MTASVTLPDGRDLAYEEYGDPAGFPVLSFHGGLSSRLLDSAPAHQAARVAGVRLLSPDRPGIGLSTYQRGRRLVDWPADVAHLTDALGIERFAVMGWSAGGAYAVVCAAKLGRRVTAAALLSSAVPLDQYGTTRGLSFEDRVLLVLSRRMPWLAAAVMKVSVVSASNARLLRAVMRAFRRSTVPSSPSGDRPTTPSPSSAKGCARARKAACSTTGSSATPGSSPWRRSRCPSRSGRARTTGRDPRTTAPSYSGTSPAPR